MELLTRETGTSTAESIPASRDQTTIPAWAPAPARETTADPPSTPQAGTPVERRPRQRHPRLARVRAYLARPPLWHTVLVCAVALVARRFDLFLNPQFWAEDGTLFFLQAWEYGARAIVEPYAGYLHVTQRLVAFCALQFDPRWAPAVFVGASLALTLYVAARTQSSRLPFRPHVAFALAVVLIPDAFEVLLFLVNIQWVLAGGLLLLLISADGRRWYQHTHDSLAAVLLGLTGPFSVLFGPLFLWRALQRRTLASSVVAALVLACAAVQAWLILKAPPAPADTRLATETFLAIPGMRIGASLFAGRWATDNTPLLVETALGALTMLGAAALASMRGPARVERIWLALALVVLLGASFYRCRNVLPGLCHAGFGSRYFFAPQLIFVWLLATLTGEGRRWLAAAAAVALAWIFAVNLPRLRESGLADQRWTDHAARLRAGESTTIFINPTDWSFTVSARTAKP